MEYVLCSECFHTEGLKKVAKKYGCKIRNRCPNCGTNYGIKLTIENIQDLCNEYFVWNTSIKTEYGGASLLRMTDTEHNELEFPSLLQSDFELISCKADIGLRHYGPRTYLIGEVSPLYDLSTKGKSCQAVLDKIIQLYPKRYLNHKDYFYKLRVNPYEPFNFAEYDSAPIKFTGKSRLDIPNVQMMYGSQNIEICLHECRVTIKDQLFLAKMRPLKRLKLIDMSKHIIEEDITPFDSVGLSINHLFSAESHSYKICKKISKFIYESGYDGIIYPSYFSQVKNKLIPNIALFGAPIKDCNLKIESIDRIKIDKVDYKYDFGAVLKW